MRLSPEAKAYFRAQVALVKDRGFWSCLAAAETLAGLLLRQGRAPWLGRLRHSEVRDDAVFHAPLIPICCGGAPAWTHYLCAEGGIAYDPVASRLLALRRDSHVMSGRALGIETFVAPADVRAYLECRRVGSASAADLARCALLARIVGFIRSLGIEVGQAPMHRATLVPGIDIQRGGLVVDATRMCKPADLLHEAGHIALKLPSERAALDGTLDGTPAEEMSAIAWTWAAAHHLQIDPREVFHEEVISGNGPTLLENFSAGRYVGVPMLQYWRMTREPSRPDGYPRMTRWVRDG